MCVCVCVGEPDVEVRQLSKAGAFLWRVPAQRYMGHHRRPLSDADSYRQRSIGRQIG